MRIARVLAPVHSLGPGERLCLWTQGCSKKCRGCISEEMQPFTGEQIEEKMLAGILIQTAKGCGCKGLTISGGDPMEQPEKLLALLMEVRSSFPNILVYTGYTMEEIREGKAGTEAQSCLAYIDVLIDGRYREDLNVHDCVLRGPNNQRIWYLDPSCKGDYEAYMEKGRMLETFSHKDAMIVTGIQDKRRGQ